MNKCRGLAPGRPERDAWTMQVDKLSLISGLIARKKSLKPNSCALWRVTLCPHFRDKVPSESRARAGTSVVRDFR